MFISPSMPTARWLMLALATLWLSGCHTAPVALEQANYSVRLMSMLDEQLTEFRQIQSAAEKARLDSLAAQKSNLLRVSESSTVDIQAAKSAGDSTREPFAEKLLSDADGLAKLKALTVEQRKAYEEKLGSLLTPIPSVKTSIAQAQTKAALLGQELDRETRFAELQEFLTALGENVKANRKKIGDAKAAAAAADSSVKDAP